MIEKSTVFVLGAGASAPYKFPLGRELSRIITRLAHGYPHFETLVTNGFGAGQITALRDAFSKSGVNSIDAFLEHRTELIEIGKAVIATVMIAFEDDSTCLTLIKATGCGICTTKCTLRLIAFQRTRCRCHVQLRPIPGTFSIYGTEKLPQ
jgi:hypothetical protein